MYDDLIKRLREASKMSEALAVLLPNSDGSATAKLYNEAAGAIEELEKCYQIMADAYETEVTKERWISATERLPEEDKTVLTFVKKHQCILLDWMHDNKWCCFGVADYWMPLPEPPKEE